MVIAIDNWQPVAGIELEENAWQVLRSEENYAVIAGPGAGKTELLAQRACYLLQTGRCHDPKRILAISFKKDAASNLQERVVLRCGQNLAQRFDSFTFDAFSKSILDRFISGLPRSFCPPANYSIVSNRQDQDNLRNRVSDLVREIKLPDSLPNHWSFRSLNVSHLLNQLLCKEPLIPSRLPNHIVDWGIMELWKALIASEPCILTFDMVKRLASLILEGNPLLLSALRITYDYVFLDEFQDTTYVQYDLLQRCFLTSQSVLTAVGDNKQRIMLWANAMPDAFDRFQADFNASSKQMLLNHRSHPELVRIQQYLMSAIDPECETTAAAKSNDDVEAACIICSYESAESEAVRIRDLILERIKSGVNPSDICLLSRVRPDIYTQYILPELLAYGVKCRLEDQYQDLIKDDLVRAVLSLLHAAIDKRSPKHWNNALNYVCWLSSIDLDNLHSVFQEEKRLSHFLGDLSESMIVCEKTESSVGNLIQVVINFLGEQAIQAIFPQCKNSRNMVETISNLARLLALSYEKSLDWSDTLLDFEGNDTVSAMTIHKSKGLEYDTVIFIGLEDAAWIKFAEQKNEHTCAFFVAFSRAKNQVYFTFCASRPNADGRSSRPQARTSITSLYRLLRDAGVRELTFS